MQAFPLNAKGLTVFNSLYILNSDAKLLEARSKRIPFISYKSDLFLTSNLISSRADLIDPERLRHR